MTTGENIVVAQGLHRSFGRGTTRVHVLRGLNLAVRRGEFLAVMGPSGCGKSTLLHLLGLMTPCDVDASGQSQGRIMLDGCDVSAGSDALRNDLRRTKIGFVFQRFNLISVLSAADNVAVSLNVRRASPDPGLNEMWKTLGVDHLRRRKPGAMSIGEQQRVAVLRAIAHRPALLLADEPTGNLDSDNAADLLKTFCQMNRDRGQTIVMITHSAEAASFADRTVRMKDGLLLDQPL